MTQRFFALNWIVRARQGRAVRLTDRGRPALLSQLGVTVEPNRRIT